MSPAPRFRLCAPGCGVCGLSPVEQPHYCDGDLPQRHASWLRGNQRYRAAVRAAASETHAEAPDRPPSGIQDLCQWGDYHHCLRWHQTPTGIDLRTVARATRRIALLDPAHQRALWAAYVLRGDVDRESARPKPKGRNQTGKPLPTTLAAAELAYLSRPERAQ